MTVLLTGFEPFEGQSVNASWLAVQAVAAGWAAPPRLEVVQLPVSFVRAPAALLAALEAFRPDTVVCVGEAGDRTALEVERVAVNVADARIPDNDGAQPIDEAVVVEGPVAYLTGLPVRTCVDAATRAGVPAGISNSAGTFVCNAVFYTLARALDGTGAAHGFVHVPRTPDQLAGERTWAAVGTTEQGSGMRTDVAARGLSAVIAASAGR